MQEDIYSIALLTLQVAGMATVLGACIGIPLGTLLGLSDFRGKGAVRVLTFTFYGFPPVVAGLLVFMLLSRDGPLGEWGWLFTVKAMVLSQLVLVVPLITGLTMTAVDGLDPALKETALSLGANRRQYMTTLALEARIGILASVMVGFGRAIAEVGGVMIVGGNIKFHTRTLTTAIVQEVRMGNLDYAVSLGALLMLLALGIYLLLFCLQEAGRE